MGVSDFYLAMNTSSGSLVLRFDSESGQVDGIHGFPVTRLFSPDGYSHFRTSRL